MLAASQELRAKLGLKLSAHEDFKLLVREGLHVDERLFNLIALERALPMNSPYPVKESLHYVNGHDIDGYVLCFLGSSRESFEQLTTMRSLVHDLVGVFQPLMLVGVYFSEVRLPLLRLRRSLVTRAIPDLCRRSK